MNASTVLDRAVFVAGDDSLPVFDNAVAAIAAQLGDASSQRLSAASAILGDGQAQRATLANVTAAIASINPGPGQACLVFLTSHGAHARGLWLAPAHEFLTPDLLDHVLARGCGAAPTVTIVSACYTGDFARGVMARPNRIVLTAARADRPSFGCGAGEVFTFYDRCLLAALDQHASTWRAAEAQTRHCVTRTEHEKRLPPSEPQSWFGAAVVDLPIVRAPTHPSN